jgi:hypothetical protein
VNWFRYQYPQYRKLLFSVPNGGVRTPKNARVLKAEGVTAGVSDLLLLVPSGDYHGFCIEMKIGKNKQSDLQKEWQLLVTNQGYKYKVIYSVEEFRTDIKTYLEDGK